MQCYCFVSDYFYYQYAYTFYSWTGKLVCRHKQKDTCSPKTLQSVSSVHSASSAGEAEISETSLPYCPSGKVMSSKNSDGTNTVLINYMQTVLYNATQRRLDLTSVCLWRPLAYAGIHLGHREHWAAISLCVDMVVIWEAGSWDASVGAEQQ